jgi:hypothetical protein
MIPFNLQVERESRNETLFVFYQKNAVSIHKMPDSKKEKAVNDHLFPQFRCGRGHDHA